MIIFESLLTTFETSVIFEAIGSANWLESKTKSTIPSLNFPDPLYISGC